MRSLALLLISTVAYADQAQPPAGAPAPVMTRPAPHVVATPPRMPPPPPPPAPPPPPSEIAALASKVAGSYTCKGVTFVGNGASTPMTGKVGIKLALGGAWIVVTFAETAGVTFDDYRTFDPVAKQWHRFVLASTTGYTTYTSLGDTGGTWTWEGTATAPSGTMQVRDHETPGDRQLNAWGEALLGGNWQKLYEVTCKR
ncbi:MAG TPA: hypothetical protein VH143_24025 [Kofleriaceae bacterium]|jgi:hypothetical protein|nr:hypothetical protein [Kofleriaceae bacterium]